LGLDHERDLAAIVKRAQVGDPSAFETIYHRFADSLFRYLYARCGDARLAEDLTGDVWVRVVERLPAFRFPPEAPETAFTAWLYRIARNLVVDSYRRSSRALQVVEAPQPAALQAPADESLLASEEREELRTAIEQLTPEQREVVLMRFVEERSNSEVARLTGRSEGAVKVMQHRALRSLARLLERYRQPAE
jgi:RNA polymerase sigma-70 factor, ECF subfamily